MQLIKLTQGMFAQVDDEDFEELNKYRWYAHREANTYYAIKSGARTNGGRQVAVKMHRAIFNVAPSVGIDHEDGNRLNNQRNNLKTSTCLEKQRNRISANRIKRLGIKRAYLDKRCGRFLACVMVDKKNIHLGCFFCLEKARLAYRDAEIKYFGEFARGGVN